MKIICFSFTHKGRIIGDELSFKLSKSCIYDTFIHFSNSDLEGGVKSKLADVWKEYDGIVFICATGICVRMIAPYIKNKKTDPAVIVIDDTSRFSISLLSGHLGGANRLAENVGSLCGATSVITTASDNRGIQSIDLFAQENGYYMEDMGSVKNITSMMVNGKKIGFYSEDTEVINYDNLILIKRIEDISIDLEGMIFVTSSTEIDSRIPYTILRPKSLNLGIGCRKGVEGRRIIDAVLEVLENEKLSARSIKAIGTVDVKMDEKGILEAVEHFKARIKIFTREEIGKVDYMFKKSNFVKAQIGVYSVSEPCAYLLGGRMVVEKSAHNGITISVSKEDKNG